MLEPISRPSLSEEVFKQLLDRILDGRLSAGQALPAERQLVDRLAVNRGAIREALKRLEQLGLLIIKQGESTRIQDFRKAAGLELLPRALAGADPKLRRDAMTSLVEMRSALGPDVARLAAMRGGAEAADDLMAVVEEMREAKGDAVTLQRLSMDFWDLLVEASENFAYRLTFNTMKRGWILVQDALAPILLAETGNLAGYRRLAKVVSEGEQEAARRQAARLLTRGADALEAWIADCVE